jgi:hypothetical protein
VLKDVSPPIAYSKLVTPVTFTTRSPKTGNESRRNWIDYLRGALAFILSFPSNWQFALAWLYREGIGRYEARRIIKELVVTGYCQWGRQSER